MAVIVTLLIAVIWTTHAISYMNSGGSGPWIGDPVPIYVKQPVEVSAP